MTQLVQPPLYIPRVRIWGNSHWICPYSGHFNRSRLGARDFRMPCTGAGCGHRFIPGFVLYPIQRGSRGNTPPPDWVIPEEYELDQGMREAFPAGDLAIVPWRRHQPTHVLVDPQSADFNVELLTRSVHRIAQQGRQDDFGQVNMVRDELRLARLGAAFEAVVGHQYGV